jgi:hypothetical protein
LANATTTLSESAATTVRIKVADVVINDDALGTNILGLDGADAALFEIETGQLFIKANVNLDFETNAALTVTVSVDDSALGNSPDSSVPLAIEITDANEPPSLALVNSTGDVPEAASTSSRIKVADVAVSDDALGTFVLSLSGEDSSLFEIDSSQLFVKANAVLDFESNPVLDVTVSVDDISIGGSPDNSATLAINVIDVNEPPLLSLANSITTVSESANRNTRVRVADIVISDDALGANSLSLSGEDGALFEIDGNSVFVRVGAPLDAETNPVLNVTVIVDDASLGTTFEGSVPLAI